MSEELINAAKARVADVVAKINGGMGEDISYDEKFEEIKAQAEKLSSVTGEQPDWSAIAVTSEELLQEKSKDFRVACYLAACKGRKNVEGMLDALVLLREMADQYWEEMHPPLRRARARGGMLSG
jgi:type VI secretion system protein VasJ